jgi:hypothetical protein
MFISANLAESAFFTNLVPPALASSNQLYEEIQAFAHLIRSLKEFETQSREAVRRVSEKGTLVGEFEPDLHYEPIVDDQSDGPVVEY